MNDMAVTRRFSVVGVVAPAVLTAAALGTQALWMGDLPDPVAIHWGANGADGSGPAWAYLLITLALGFGLPAWLWGTGLPRLRRGARGWSFRFLAAIALGMSAFAAIAMTWAVGVQRGLDSWTDAPSIGGAFGACAAIALMLGFIGWAVQPKTVAAYDEITVEDMTVAEGERVVWLGTAKSGPALVATIIGLIVAVAGLGVYMWVDGAFGTMWALFGLVVVLSALAMAMLEADVRVDANGVEVRGPARFPRIAIALDDVKSASAINVDGLGSFGGFGWRRVPGAQGVIMRNGEALRIERIDGPDLVVTVPGAAKAAAVVEALKARA